MKNISREEMIQMAKETRKNVTSDQVSKEELAQYPVEIKQLSIPAGNGQCRVYYSYAKGGKHSDALIINFHGGGFIRERTSSDELFCRKLNHILGCKIMDVDYPIAPDHPYPAAVQECFDVVKWCFSHAADYQIDPGKVILMGHSAGGNLAIVTEMQLLSENTGMTPLGIVAEYPPLDLYTDPEDKPKRGNGIPAERARLYNLYYCSREEQKKPYVSPIYADEKSLMNFPPTFILTAGQDDLCTEGEDFALKLARCGNEVTLKRVLGAGHAFTIYRKEKHQEGLAAIVKYCRQLLMLN